MDQAQPRIEHSLPYFAAWDEVAPREARALALVQTLFSLDFRARRLIDSKAQAF
jgi:hypothetical protein